MPPYPVTQVNLVKQERFELSIETTYPVGDGTTRHYTSASLFGDPRRSRTAPSFGYEPKALTCYAIGP